MTEQWKPVVGWPGYEVSDHGRVRSLDRVIVRRNRWGQDREVCATKTRCKREHEFTAENTYVNPRTGKRSCRACVREQHRDRERQRRAIVRASREECAA